MTEDTIRTDRETVKRLYSAAIRSGARAIVLCDTVGHATPEGAYNLVKFAIEDVVKPSGEKIRVDWHGHCDRGLAIANSLWAVAAGAHQVHAAANSLGERVGNTPMELMLVNLRLMGLIDRDLSHMKEYCESVAAATHTVIPPNYPVIGKDAFRTATGVHAAAIVKAFGGGLPCAGISSAGGLGARHRRHSDWDCVGNCGGGALGFRRGLADLAQKPAPQFSITMDDFHWQNAVKLTGAERNEAILETLRAHSTTD